jgi:hypothetical protein
MSLTVLSQPFVSALSASTRPFMASSLTVAPANNNLNTVASLLVQKQIQQYSKASVLSFVTHGLIKKLLFAYLGSKLSSVFGIKNYFTSFVGAAFGFVVLGSLFTKFEDWLQAKIKGLLDKPHQAYTDENWHLSDLTAKLTVMVVLGLIGVLKKGFLMQHSFNDSSTYNEMSLATKITKPVHWLARKAGIQHKAFYFDSQKNILENFHQMSLWFNSLSKTASASQTLISGKLISALSKIGSFFSGNILGWPYWRESIHNGHEYDQNGLMKDAFIKIATLAPLGVGLEYIFSGACHILKKVPD